MPLLAIPDKESLLAHLVVGQTWECFVIENLLATATGRVEGFFYRTGGGAEIDLLLTVAGWDALAIEVKRSLTPRPERGFYAACADLSPAKKFIVYPGSEHFRLASDIEAIPLPALAEELAAPI